MRVGPLKHNTLRAAKFPPFGGRGSATEVRAVSYGAGDFDWVDYVKRCHEETVVIGLAEDKVFFDNIDDIMSVDGLDMISFGPTDLAMSLVISPTLEEARRLYEQGVNAVLLRSDIAVLQATCRQMMDDVVKPLRAGA